MFQAQDRVVITDKQQFGGVELLLDGEIITINGAQATVAIDNETVPRSIPISSLRKSEETYGEQTGRPNELPVHNAIRS